MALALIALSLPAVAAEPDQLSASVRVGGCGGTIVHRTTGHIWGISAGHCARVGSPVTVTFSDESSATGKWLHIDRKTDLAAFVVASTTKRVQVAQVAQQGATGAFRADGSRGPIELVRHGHREMKSTTGGTYERTYYGVKDGKFRSGDSGAGVWVGKYLVGVASHGDDDEDLYACRVGQLREFAAELSKAADLPSWGDKDRTREILLLQKRIAALEGMISKQSPVPGPPGPAGPAGPQGQPGPVGSTDTGLKDRLLSLEDWRENFKAIIRVKIVPQKEKTDGK